MFMVVKNKIKVWNKVNVFLTLVKKLFFVKVKIASSKSYSTRIQALSVVEWKILCRIFTWSIEFLKTKLIVEFWKSWGF